MPVQSVSSRRVTSPSVSASTLAKQLQQKYGNGISITAEGRTLHVRAPSFSAGFIAQLARESGLKVVFDGITPRPAARTVAEIAAELNAKYSRDGVTVTALGDGLEVRAASYSAAGIAQIERESGLKVTFGITPR